MRPGAEPKSRRFERRVLGGKYQLGRLIGRGGMGAVWIAEHLDLRSPVAVKVLEDTESVDESVRRRFMTEARASANLRSPNIVQVFDFGVDDGTPFMVMELLEGETLKERLKRGPLSLEATKRIIGDVARGLARAHQADVVHRDLKPDNIFLARDEEREHAKILDFGIARVADTLASARYAASTETGRMMGTPFYMSPEQAMNSKDVDHRTDIWALGVIAYECLTGQRPFDSESVMALAVKICTAPIPVPSKEASVPAEFDAWFARTVNRTVEDRFQSAREASEALRAVGAASASAASGSRGGSQSRTASRPGGLGVVVGVVAALAAVGAGVGVFLSASEPAPSDPARASVAAASVHDAAASPPVVAPPAKDPPTPTAVAPTVAVAETPTEAPAEPETRSKEQPRPQVRRGKRSPSSTTDLPIDFSLRDPWGRPAEPPAAEPEAPLPEPPPYSRKELNEAFASADIASCKAVGAVLGQRVWLDGVIDLSSGRVVKIESDVRTPVTRCIANRVKEIELRVVGDGTTSFHRFFEVP